MRFHTPYNQRSVPPHRDNDSAQAPIDPAASRKWNTWWARRSPNVKTNDNPPVCIGIDAGSKTLKLVILDKDGEVVYSAYHRHRSDVRTSIAELLHEAIWRQGDLSLPVAITGSAGISLSQALGLPFVQEVIASTNAVRSRYPQADCIIELGGEDAKITYLSDTPEHRMNATCAGGTGDFIDGIASMLGCKTRELSKLAFGHQRTYSIASRCAVFAQMDVRPLINSGAKTADIAQSAFEAVVRQTLGGLACGRPIRGTVVFLGGPLEHIPALVIAFRRKLGLTAKTGIKPPDAHLYPAMGAIETAEAPPVIALSELERRARAFHRIDENANTLEPLFESEGELEAFTARHYGENAPAMRLENVKGPLFLGFDAGSTTCKYVLIDTHGVMVASDYRTVDGDSLQTARAMLEELLMGVEGGAYSKGKRYIAQAVVTGYGEDLLRAGFGFDSGVVETVAHLRAALHFQPNASFVLDIGGQDMKALWVRDGKVIDAVLNEACSSGCGAFVQSSAKSLNLSYDGFTREALAARHPIDLGAKCTVFMTSRVRHAQKSGAEVGDLAAGIAYSVVTNALTRIIGKDRAVTLGDKVVVQGGAFKSDAVLRAFEKVTGVQAMRPSNAHLMGAYGCALAALDSWRTKLESCPDSARQSCLLGLAEVRSMKPKRRSARCGGCGNDCLLNLVDFGSGKRFISGNRCEKAYDAIGEAHSSEREWAPNAVAFEQRLIASYGDKSATGARGKVRIGLMNVLNVYENMPFWHTLFAELGFSIVVPDDTRAKDLMEAALETIPSESACYPAKLAHLRFEYLVRQGASVVFMPRFERGSRCPVSCLYADVLEQVGSSVLFSRPQLRAIRPRRMSAYEEDKRSLYDEINAWIDSEHAVSIDEFNHAFECALDEQRSFENALELAGAEALAWVREMPQRRMVVLHGRPYHCDSAVLHGIDSEITRLGFAVVGPPSTPKSVFLEGDKPLWKPAKHLVKAVRAFADDPQVEIVALRSFGCGYDAVSFDEARDVSSSLHRPFTELKIDDIADTAHIRIRLRTLAYTTQTAHAMGEDAIAVSLGNRDASTGIQREWPDVAGWMTPDLCSTAKALVSSALQILNVSSELEELVVPDVCKECLTDALPFELKHIVERVPGIRKDASIEKPPWELAKRDASACSEAMRENSKRCYELGYCLIKVPRNVWNERSERSIRTAEGEREGSALKVGLVGNPLLVFNPSLNDHVAELLRELGCTVVYPDIDLIQVDDVRYLEQLRAFSDAGVQRVIYLQSFGCLKGHVQSRGALRELEQLFPELSITVVDFDTESSALNRENRIRLAVSQS